MRHAAAFCNQFPVTAHIASLILYNPSATADIQEKLLATNREILNYYRFIKPLLSTCMLEYSPGTSFFSSR